MGYMPFSILFVSAKSKWEERKRMKWAYFFADILLTLFWRGWYFPNHNHEYSDNDISHFTQEKRHAY